ncbi:hypothetical protein LCGC14_2488990, partial [marine sediment metagenome]
LMPFALPVNPEAVLKVLEGQGVAPRYANLEQARRIAWRIIKDWVEAQLALIATEMVTLEQVFLPYLKVNQGQTLYDYLLESGRFKALQAGDSGTP